MLGPKLITEHSHRFLVPHRRLLRCTLPPAELWRSWIQYIPSLQPILQDMWLYGMVQFQRHENRSLIANAGISRPSATPHRCTEAPTGTGGTPGPHRSHQRGFPYFLLTHAKGFSLL